MAGQRVPTTQVDVLTAIVKQLQTALGLTESACFLSVHPEAQPTVNQNVWLTVSPEDGQFDDGAWGGGGQAVLIENTWAVITIFSAMRLDRPEHDVAFLTDVVRGVLTVKRKVLKALGTFDPVNSSADFILCQPMAPTNSPRPLNDRLRIGDCQLWFSTIFLWDIES